MTVASGSPQTTSTNSSTGGSDDWINPTNVKIQDLNYATVTINSPSSYYIIASNLGFALPSNATLNNITGSAVVKANTAGTGGSSNRIMDFSMKLYVNGSIVGADKAEAQDSAHRWLITDTTKTYDFTSEIAALGLTYADVNAVNFGWALSCTGNRQNGNETGSVDIMYMTITYTTSGGVVVASGAFFPFFRY